MGAIERPRRCRLRWRGRSFTVRSLEDVVLSSQCERLSEKGDEGMAERIEPVGAPVAYETPDAAAMPAGRRDYGRIPFDGLPNT